MSPTALEIIVQTAVDDAVRTVTAHANQSIAELRGAINANPGLPYVPEVQLQPPTIVLAPKPDPVPAKVDASNRAARTFVGGLVATALSTLGTEVAQLVTGGTFDPLDGNALKTAGVGLVFSITMSLVSYTQRFLQPPKVDQ